MKKLRLSYIDVIAMSAFRFYVRLGIDVSLDYYPGGDYYLLEIQFPIGQELPKYDLLENPSISFCETYIDRYTNSYLFSLICD